MAHKRFVTSDMSSDEDLAEIAGIDTISALMWPWFITGFDDWGRMDATSAAKIKLSMFPGFNFSPESIDAAIKAYSDKGLVYLYSINGKRYLAIEPCKYYKYQTYIGEKKRKDDRSKIPAPEHPCWENCAECSALSRTCAKDSGFATLNVPSPSPSPSKDDEEERRVREGAVFKFFNNNIGLITPFQTEIISQSMDVDGIEPEMILEILQDSVGKEDSWSWIKRVLDNSISQNIKTFEQYQAKKVERKNRGNKDSPQQTRKSAAEERMERIRKAREEAHRMLDTEGVRDNDTS
jgi:DnaD/phage-associated family protein